MNRHRRSSLPAAVTLGILVGGLIFASDPAGAATTTVVRPGQSLWQISVDYHVGLDDLARANAMDVNDVLFAGRQLQVPDPPDARPVVARPVVARPVVARPVVARPVVARPGAAGAGPLR